MLRKFLVYSILLAMLSCSKEDSGPTYILRDHDVQVANQWYRFDHGYLVKKEGSITVMLSNGELEFDSNQEISSYSNDFSHLLTMVLHTTANDLSNISYPIEPAADIVTNENIAFMNINYEISNGQALSYDSLFSPQEIMYDNGRILVNKATPTAYRFSYGFYAEAGRVSGDYAGEFEKINF